MPLTGMLKYESGNNVQSTMHNTPEDVIPSGTVPDTAKQEYNSKINIHPHLALPVAT